MDRKRIALLSIMLLFMIINLRWILYDSPEYSNEDMTTLSATIRMLKLDHFSLSDVIDAASRRPVMPIMYYAAFLVIRSEYSPLILNMILTLLLAFVGLKTADKIYGNNAGTLAYLLVLTSPMVIAYSRTAQQGTMLMLLLCTNFYFFVRSDFLTGKRSTICWLLSAIAGVSTKFTLLPYLVSLAGFGLMYQHRDLLAGKPFKIKASDLALFAFILFTLIYLPASPDFRQYGSWTKAESSGLKPMSFFEKLSCDTMSYLSLLIHTQLGIFLSILFAATAISIIKKSFAGKPDTPDAAIIIVFAANMVFFTYFVVIKNAELTTVMLPLLLVAISGFISRLSKAIRNLLVGACIVFGILSVAPGAGAVFNRIYLDVGTDRCSSENVDYFHMGRIYLINRDFLIGKTGITKDIARADRYHSTARLFKETGRKDLLLADYTTDNNQEIILYAFMEGIDLEYATCGYFPENPGSAKSPDYYMISDYDFSKPICLACIDTDESAACNDMRDDILKLRQVQEFLIGGIKYKIFANN